LGIVRAKVAVKGLKGFREGTALVDAGAAMTVVDGEVADAVGVTYTGRRRMLMSAAGHRLEGEVAIVRELNIEGEVLDYEKVLAVRLSEEVKKTLRKLDVDDSIIVGITTIELAGFIQDTTTGKLRKSRLSSSKPYVDGNAQVYRAHVSYVGYDIKGGRALGYVPNSSKIRRHGWEPKVSLDEGLRKVVE